MKEIKCDIIRDLLPSYSDKISSESTNELVNEHLKNCKECREILKNMNKEIDTTITDIENEQINYLKGFKKKKRLLIILSIILTIIILVVIFIANVFNKNILIDRLLFVDVNKFNVEYMYIEENESIQKNELKVYLYADDYKDMYLTGGYELKAGENEIYFKIAAKELPEGVEFDGSGMDISFILEDNIERIYIQDTKNNLKEIWNKEKNVKTEDEWKKWYIDSYVPEKIKELYNLNYDNIKINTSIWKKVYNNMLKGE